MKKMRKLLALIIAVTMLFGISTSYVKAEDEGACDHFGENFSENDHTYVGNTETINCSYGIPHPCYVMGELVSCQTHYYTMRTPYYCRKCKTFLYYKYTYSELYHQYNHSN